MTIDESKSAILLPARIAEIRVAAEKAPAVTLTSRSGSVFVADSSEQDARVDRGLGPTIAQVYGTNKEAYPWAEFFAAAPVAVRDLLAHLDAIASRTSTKAICKIYRDLRWEADGDKPHVEEHVAVQMYERGFAAGAVSVSSENDDPATEGAILILMKRHDAELHEAHANGRSEAEAERGQLQAIIDGEREGYQRLLADRDATIVRLAAEHDAIARRFEFADEERRRALDEVKVVSDKLAEEREAWQTATGSDSPEELSAEVEARRAKRESQSVDNDQSHGSKAR
jgi:hypothetical protein